MKRVILLLALICLAPCASESDPVLRKPSFLRCSPSTLHGDAKLLLRFGMPHPDELAIIAPDGTYFFLVYDTSLPRPDSMHPLMTKEQFGRLDRLELDPRTAKASPFVHERNESELIFGKAGAYVVRIADSLETDAAVESHDCTVRFAP